MAGMAAWCGICLVQGRLLTTPEMVPFRLSQCIVDGMGAMGTHGTMTRCCEEALRVRPRLRRDAMRPGHGCGHAVAAACSENAFWALPCYLPLAGVSYPINHTGRFDLICLQVMREHATQLLTVLSVLLHDPLAKWAMTRGKAQRRQRKEGGPPSDADDQGVTCSVHAHTRVCVCVCGGVHLCARLRSKASSGYSCGRGSTCIHGVLAETAAHDTPFTGPHLYPDCLAAETSTDNTYGNLDARRALLRMQVGGYSAQCSIGRLAHTAPSA